MKGRRLRSLVPDEELIRRRAAGESLRELAVDYGVAHTTLLRYFERPEVVKELKGTSKDLRAAERAAVNRRRYEQRVEQEVRRKAREQAARERGQARLLENAAASVATPRRRSRGRYAAWLDERDARQPLTRADLHSQNDDIAAKVVAEGGGIHDVIEATDLRTLENVKNLIDPEILERAYDNDRLRSQRLLS